MTVSDLIELLIAFKEKHGDMEVLSSSLYADPAPRLQRGDHYHKDLNMPPIFCIIGREE